MLSHLAVSGNGWGGSTSSDVLAVHNYDLKKKTYSRLVIGRNDMFWQVHNYDLKKKNFSCLTVGRTDSIMVLARAWMFW
jgi:hypothetical protein